MDPANNIYFSASNRVWKVTAQGFVSPVARIEVLVLLAAHNLFNKRSYVPVLSPANSNDYQLLERNLSVQVEVRF